MLDHRIAASLLSLLALAPFAAALQAEEPDWTVFPTAPCALADVRWSREATLELAARGADQDFSRQGGERRGCGVPSNAEAILVDILVDSSAGGKLMAGAEIGRGGPAEILVARPGLTPRRGLIEMCSHRGCRSDVQLSGLRKGDRVRLFVRGYLMRGRAVASRDLLAGLLERDRQRVKDCEVIVGPQGQIARVGSDCGLDYGGVPVGDASTPVTEDDGEELTGCPYEYFPEDEWFEQGVRFAFPVEQEEWIIQAPIHMDHDREPAGNELACQPYFPGLLCYDNHEGTDFSLIGGFWKQDDKSVWAVAAAKGVVMAKTESNFDRCQADLNPLDCSESVCTTVLGQEICSPCAPNANFGQPFCQQGDEAPDYDSLPANYVKLCHSDGTVTRYYHLMKDEVEVSVGDEVECGDRLGLIASSGRSSAPHLHFDVKLAGAGSGEWTDPFDAGSGQSLWVQPSLPGLLPGTNCQE